MSDYTTIVDCRGCGHNGLIDVVSLGKQHVVDFVMARAITKRPVAPLTLALCQSCSLLQLRHSVDPDKMYKTFWYKSGMNESMRQALAHVTNRASALAGVNPGDWVLDIGANDGTLLDTYLAHGINKVGVDPAENFGEGKDNWITGYFNKEAVRELYPDQQFKVITAIAMFYDLEEPLQFLQDCHSLLAENGLLVIQMNYLPAMLQNMAFDNISHEHLTYFTLTSLMPLVQQAGLEIITVSENEVNGGSLRVYITHPGASLAGFGHDHKDYWAASARVYDTLVKESRADLESPLTYTTWASAIHTTCRSIRALIASAQGAKRRVALYGASTRGSTLMQTMYPGVEYAKAPFPFAAERDASKIGLRTAGYGVPIISEDAARKLTDVFLVLPWHFRETILEREKSWIDAGGEFIFPLPFPEVVNAEYLRTQAKEKQTAAEAG